MNFDEQNLAAVALLQAGRSEEAAAIFCQIPEHLRTATVWINLGLAYQQVGSLEASLQCLDLALVLAPQAVDAWYNRGVTLNHMGRNLEAKSAYEKVLERVPSHLHATLNLGICQVALKGYKVALSLLAKVLLEQPDQGLAWYWQAMALMELERWDEAAASFEQACRLMPGNCDALIGLACSQLHLRNFEKTIQVLDQAFALEPESFSGHYYRGNALRELEHYPQAIASYEHALSLNPQSVETLANMGVCYELMHDFETSLVCYEKVLAIEPQNTVGLFNSANALGDLGRLHEAIARYDELVATGHPTPGYRVNKAFCLLKLGDYAQGWPLYEGRWENPHIADRYHFDQPIWLGGTSLRGVRILLHSEQGLGDTLQFCRYVKQVKALGAHVILQVQDPLLPLLTSLKNVDELIGKNQELPAFDVHCPLLSLPLAFKTTRESIDGTLPYLWADEQAIQKWHGRLGHRHKPVVGLAWQGAKAYRFDFRRSMPLNALEPLGALADRFDFVVLQKDLTPLDLETLATFPWVRVLPEQLDFADAAALVAAVDCVVSVDTALAHLAGALAKPAALLLPTVADWRWVDHEPRSPWYPSTRMFWQTKTGDWSGPVQALIQSLLVWKGGPLR